MTDELDVLLVEDDAGDARVFEELLREGADALDQIDLDGSSPERIRTHRASTLDAGIDRLTQAEFDVILLDLDLPDSGGCETLVKVIDQCGFTPVIVLADPDDRDLGVDVIRSGAKDYLVKDEVTGDGLLRAVRHAVEETHRERARHREQLRSLNHLNRIGQDVTHAVITCSTREELERAVCDRFVESDAYQFAWIGELHQPTDRLSPRVTASSDSADLGDATIPVGYDTAAEGPESKALRARDSRVVRDVQSDPEYRAVREQLEGQPYRSVAALPIAYEGVCYGVLALYAGSAAAFSTDETEILERLCDAVGHALAAIERKDALVEDTILQLEFRVDGVAAPLVALTADHECALDITSVIRTESGTLVYGRVEGVSAATVEDIAAEIAFFDGFEVQSADGDELKFEATTTAADALVTAVAEHGGRVASGRIRDGEFRLVVEFPSGRDKRQLVGLVEHHCPGSTIQAQRTVQRNEPDVSDAQSVFRDRLTEKQRETLETAFAAGYFDWPRANTGEEVAAQLGISQATFSQHLRGAERELFAALFASDDEAASGESNWKSIKPETDGD
ncbi:bacterio-opsin activator domain-containing protein [Halorubrum sp. AD140]|uniref:bacterio-opsin activator domain-containing protein n=1 Tax=Halorubrum sp. AD140 TaxID=3050073 RepID=UPI002ACC6D63|nr:bacterio-opsin activator domain-containing protein [Halorubrum sp. AD140]MDZ5809936.1 bacterio-opsin activator domain-containing protein [Halorubrum sp. AD140]